MTIHHEIRDEKLQFDINKEKLKNMNILQVKK